MQNDDCGIGAAGYPTDCELTEALRARALHRNRPIERNASWLAALPQAKQVRLLLLDVDGVLTDGSITYGTADNEIKSFNTQDGLGIRLLQENGMTVGIITARTSEAVTRRALDLQISQVYQGKQDKLTMFETILKETGLRPPQVAYMGDDWLDLPILNRVGFAAAPANAVPEIRQRVHYITERSGGRGAVREVCDLILEAQGQLNKILARFDR